jgi:hypothetical protein
MVRIFAVILGYGLACVAASLVFTIGTLTPQWQDWSSLGLPPAALWAVIAIGGAVIAGIAFLPTLLIIALAEAFAWRSILIYGASGAVLALALGYGIDFAGYVGEAGSLFAREREVLAAAGISGGFVYWLIAGRNAGVWQSSRPSSAKS